MSFSISAWTVTSPYLSAGCYRLLWRRRVYEMITSKFWGDATSTMSSLPSSNPIPKPNSCRAYAKGSRLSNSQCWLCFKPRQRKPISLSIGISYRRSLSVFDVRSSFEPPEVLEEMFMEYGSQSPEFSFMYRCSNIPRPNQIVLEAQAKVCTGPEQTRPLTEEQAVNVLNTILKSGYP